jgi:hypothetical protein
MPLPSSPFRTFHTCPSMLTGNFSSASHRSLTGNTQRPASLRARRHNARVAESFPGAVSLGRWNLPLAVTFETVTVITANGGESWPESSCSPSKASTDAGAAHVMRSSKAVPRPRMRFPSRATVVDESTATLTISAVLAVLHEPDHCPLRQEGRHRAARCCPQVRSSTRKWRDQSAPEGQTSGLDDGGGAFDCRGGR